ncbi:MULTISPECIES: LysR family transcriptional regulator [Streptomyces]|uniref:LysR family transcriptional regulator n=1 Tax=Streptomyces venezuelae TaxID=54571 RepID=A0A5P2BPU7_STRVZ|nr:MULTISPECIES: LysR family transcriptional regulator [Streptomyces]NEA06344.1 LysR family transcriptional regulator [Streptomyces sp. SID10116]MYY81592.1 LysR family transcriptional regulator [Streptomyces sp. SID335]MYZ15567.1 LysR family transcriptional regulator [Streptomyces sp. SID337]NDZ90838.1 LysR family transcriptional regulator [Streptomyces sp. SID10115]NEB46926.1 LysR family transcriptional regulator [Streptomyces sp. SID339]
MGHGDTDGGAAARADAEVTTSLDLNQLRTFLAVYRSGSFTAAARLLGLSQPTVTAQIRSLERRLDRELFERLPRGAAPAPFADELAARIVEPLDALAEVAGHGSDSSAEPVHVAGPAELLSHCVLPRIAPLVEKGVVLRVATGLTDDLLEEMRAGRHDLLIATARPRGRTPASVPLADEEFVLVASPVWAERIGGAPRLAVDGPAVLHGVPLVAYADDLPIVRRYWRHVFGRRLVCKPAVTMPDLRAVKAAVAGGAGFTVLPRYLCVDELASGALVLLNDPDDPPINTGYLVQRPGSSDNPHVALVRDHLLESARGW